MTERKKALIAVREKVREGKHWFFKDVPLPESIPEGPFVDAFNGSLDAAVTLLEATLPGWAIECWMIWPRHPSSVQLVGTHLGRDGQWWHHHTDGRAQAEAATPALALVLAILEALIEREDDE